MTMKATFIPASFDEERLFEPGGVQVGIFTNVCPSGWTEYTTARGRYLVGVPAAGTLEAAVGTALTNSEDRPSGQHTHIFIGTALATHGHVFAGTALANHNHIQNAHDHQLQADNTVANTVVPLNNPISRGATNLYATGGAPDTNLHASSILNETPTNIAIGAGTPAGTNAAITAGTPAGINAAPAGSVSSTPAPYVQLIFCTKD